YCSIWKRLDLYGYLLRITVSLREYHCSCVCNVPSVLADYAERRCSYGTRLQSSCVYYTIGSSHSLYKLYQSTILQFGICPIKALVVPRCHRDACQLGCLEHGVLGLLVVARFLV
ncbi:hypothetical protein FOL47_002577, partial [Perkinsus chesapeaki]